MPIILCPDPDTARAIHASVDVLDDGTICFHKFQLRAHELLKQYRAMEPGAFDVRVPELGAHKGQWLQSPARSLLLLQGAYGVFSVLPAVLHEQNLQRDSPWFGTIRVWREAAGARSAGARQGNPWTTYDRLNLSRVVEHAGVLAAVYSVDEPFNPLHRDPALLNRIIIAELQQLMMIREHELPQSEFTEFDGGDRVFAFESILRLFPWVIGDCPPEVRETWTEGLRRYVDRQSIGELRKVVYPTGQQLIGLVHSVLQRRPSRATSASASGGPHSPAS